MRLLFFSILYIAIITAENDRCISSDNPSVVTSRGYDIGDTLSIEDQQRPYNVCHSDNNYLVGETFTFNDFNGYENGGDFNIIIISMNATWWPACFGYISMMDELLEGINENEHLKFIVSLDNNEINPMLYNCTEWGDLYSEYGDFGNDPMILNGDEDLDGDGYPDNYIWNTLSPASTYSAYALIDHNMVVRYMFDTPNLYDFQNNYIPNLLDGIYGCTDENASNYDSDAAIDDGSCEYYITGDINLDGQINILDIVQLANMILSDDYQESADLNGDGNLNILDIVQLVNIILGG